MLEGVFRPDVAWRPLVTLVACAVIPLLLWRRAHPLMCAGLGFGAGLVLSAAQAATGSTDLGLYTMGSIVLLLYALVRWGSGREIVLGLGIVVVTVIAGMFVSFSSWGDVFGGIVMLSAVIALGAAFRYRSGMWRRQLTEARTQERVALARELHDTVAHHVSAIAVQAQAGRAVASTRPEATVATLTAIEAEASRTLAEMRAMVQILREADGAQLAAQPGIAALADLGRQTPAPAVVVSLPRDLTGIPAAVDAATYRLAQESLTNALRHTCDATRVDIRVTRDAKGVRLLVVDDGRLGPGRVISPGFGLIGMTERAALLGGHLHAGPRAGGGWAVDAELPIVGSL